MLNYRSCNFFLETIKYYFQRITIQQVCGNTKAIALSNLSNSIIHHGVLHLGETSWKQKHVFFRENDRANFSLVFYETHSSGEMLFAFMHP